MSSEYKSNTPTISVLTAEIENLKQLNRDFEANYRYVFDGMTSCMAVYEVLNDGNDFIFKDFNRAAEVSSLISREDIIGKNVKDIFPGVVELGLFDVFQRVYNTAKPELHPVSNYKDQRVTLWVENYVYKLPTGEIVAIYDDITDKKKAEEALKQRMSELEAINAMSQSVSINISLDKVVDAALNQLMKTLNSDLVLIYLLEDNDGLTKSGEMRLQAVKQSSKIPLFTKPPKSLLNVGECLCGIAAKEANPIFSLNIHKDQRCKHNECKMAGIHSYTSLPLMNREKMIGIVGIGLCHEWDFSVQSSFLQSLTSIIAVSIDNIILQQQLVIHAQQLMNQAVDQAEQFEKHTQELETMVAQRTVELQKFFNAVESSPTSIVITDIYGNIEYANPFFMQLTGYTPEEAKGQNPRILKSGVHPKEFYEQMWKILASGNIWRGEICNRKKDGELYWEHAAISPLFEDRNLNKDFTSSNQFQNGNLNQLQDGNLKPDGNASKDENIYKGGLGNIVSFVAVKEDITAKKIAEKALQDSEQRYKAIFDWSQDGIIIADQQTKKFVFCNNAASNMLGYEKDELVGKSVLDIHPPAELPSILERFQSQAKGEITYAVEIPCMKKDGTIFYCDVNATPFNIDGKSCSMGFFRDVTDRRQAQEIKEDVERIMRHDLKSPLNAIIGFPKVMIEDKNLTDSQRKYLKIIMNAGQNMLDLINLSLTIYQVEMGKYKYLKTQFNLLSVIRQCISNNTSLCSNKDVQIKLLINRQSDKLAIPISPTRRLPNGEVDNNYSLPLGRGGEGQNNYLESYNISDGLIELEKMLFNGDRLLAFSVFSNIIINAVEASPINETVNIVIEYSNNLAKIMVHNKGVVPLNIRERFFDKYVTSGKPKGTGLGTYSAKLLAKIQGWDIDMKTSEEDGTALIITIF
ncbi:MAG: PAS domain S-box protein [Desulfamplus sp.]|nr:PAS domain S-box protein [Desulfamplus sp.]